jgi:hypothetical protein
MAQSGDGRCLSLGKAEGELSVFEFENQKLGAKTTLEQRLDFPCVRLSSTGDIVYGTSAKEAGLYAWERKTGKRLWRNPDLSGNVIVDPKGRWLAVGELSDHDNESPLMIVDPQTGNARFKINLQWTSEPLRVVPSYATVTGLCTTPDGSRLIGIVADGTLRQWDPLTGKELASRRYPTNSNSYSMAVSDDGKWLAVGGNDPIAIWEIATNDIVLTLGTNDTYAAQLAFTRNGRGVLSNGDLSPILWDLKPKNLPKLTLPDDELWETLSTNKALPVYRLQWALIQEPASIIRLAKERIKPADWVFDRKRFDKLVEDLDHQRFPVREAADRELTQAKQRIPLTWMRETLPHTKSEEVNTRLLRIITKRESTPDYDGRRLGRIVQILEIANTNESRALLREWSRGEGGYLVQEAKAALERMEGK